MRFVGCLAAASVSAACFVSTSAFAQVNCDTTVNPALDLPAGETRKCGLQYYKELHIAGTMKVEERDATIVGTGWLHIKSNKITIDASGVIDAISSGYRGSDMMTAPDRGPGPGGTPAEIFMMTPAAGGGGAQAGDGGRGTLTSCATVTGAEGGAAYATVMSFPNKDNLLGSAGGASLSSSNDYIGRGGNGGGVIILEAQSITINGTLKANGEDGLTTQGAAPGGGGGGAIVILADELVLGSGAILDAKGGAGGVPATSTLVGGGGGGGLIMVSATGDLSTLLAAHASVDGGTTEASCCTPTMSACGSPGIVVQTSVNPACLDADGDMAASEFCGGTDCDDANKDVHPDAPEICDGLDNNCDGDHAIDEGDLCSPGTHCGQECQMPPDVNCVTKCVPDEAGTVGAGGAPAEVFIELGGGICAAGRGGRTLVWLASALCFALLVRRRSRGNSL